MTREFGYQPTKSIRKQPPKSGSCIRRKTNCPNCGYPIGGYKCEYCGTQIHDFTNFKDGKESFFRLQMPTGDFVTVKAVPRVICVSCSSLEDLQFNLELYINEFFFD